MFTNFKEFNDSIETFSAYAKRLEQAFISHDLKEEKKLPASIFCMDPKLCNLLCDLAFPNSSESLKYEEFVDLLLKHLSPTPNKICEIIKFRKCYQNENESYTRFFC